MDSITQKINSIVTLSLKLKNKYIDEDLPINFVTIFSHSPKEFNDLIVESQKIGQEIYQNNGPVYLFDNPLKIITGELKLFRIRQPDILRPQIGCNDYHVSDFEDFKVKYLSKNSNNMFLIDRKDYQMIELRDKEFDVLVYFPNESLFDFLKIDALN